VPSILSGARVLVTGASGFLGGRLVERLVQEHGAQVCVLVRRAMSAVSVARFPVEVIVGDVLDPRALAISADGCAVVFHCVKGKGGDPALRRAVDVDGAGNVVEAARRAGARVVHVSTMAVYQRPNEGLFDENTPDAPKGDLYSDTKLQGEQTALARGAQYGVPVVVVQPAIIYGPNAPCAFETLSELRTTRMILPNGGLGICNLVYVDDAVTALILAATSDRAAGERFLISGPEHPTWAQFVGAFESMLGVHRTVSLSEHDALRLWRRSRSSRWLVPEAVRAIRTDVRLRERLLGTREAIAARWIATRVLPKSALRGLRTTSRAGDHSGSDDELPIEAVRPWVVQNMSRRARVSIEKAQRVLGYVPVFTLERGMDLTEQWARWAGLIQAP
jgi:nucleoside-diphosphate-sugar epimerase